MFENDDFQWDLDGDSFLQSLPVPDPSYVSDIGTKRKNNAQNWSKKDAINISNTEEVPDDFPQTPKAKRVEEPPPSKHSRSHSPTHASTANNMRQKFPGPAGVVGRSMKRTFPTEGPSPSDVFSQPTCSQLQLDNVINQMIDQNTVWKSMISNEECASKENSPSLLSTYNIAWAKQKLSKAEFLFKMPILAGAINALDVTFGMDPRGELVDPTGVTSCIFHRDLIERHGSILLLPGTVIVLQNVTVVKMSTGNMSVTVTMNNLVSLYFKRGQKELFEKVIHLSKDEVRRNAARLNRDEKALNRMLEHQTESQASSSAVSLESQFVPGLTSSPMTFQPFRPPVANVNRPQSSNLYRVDRPQDGGDLSSKSHMAQNLPTRPAIPSSSQSYIPTNGCVSKSLQNSNMVGSSTVTSNTKSKFSFQKSIPQSHQDPVQASSSSIFSNSNENDEITKLLDGLEEDSIFGDF